MPPLQTLPRIQLRKRMWPSLISLIRECLNLSRVNGKDLGAISQVDIAMSIASMLHGPMSYQITRTGEEVTAAM